MNRFYLFLLTTALFLVSILTFVYKAFILSFPLLPDTTSLVWTIEANIGFTGSYEPAKLTLMIPKSDETTAITDENFISQGFGLTTTEKALNRRAIWSIRKARGLNHIFYRAVVRKIELEQPKPVPPPKKELKPQYEEAYLTAANSIVEDLRLRSADNDSFIKTLVKEVRSTNPSENLRLLIGRSQDSLKQMTVAVRLLHVAGIHARIAHGIHLTEQTSDATIEHWLEAYDQQQERWITYGIDTDEASQNVDYVVWWRGEHDIAELSGGENIKMKISVSRNQEQAIASAMTKASMNKLTFVEYSPFSLPIHTQAVYRIILLVPVGALLIVVLRNIIGLRTYGTFMPVLISLAFRETRLMTGLVFLVLIIGIGLIVRFYLEHLKLLLVPRLASIVTIVVLIMTSISIISHKLGLEHGLSVALFPMVIMTMTIERMSITWEESGAENALIEALGTILASAITYFIVTNIYIEHLVFVFPELLLSVLAVILIIGRYTGFRLLELYRFRALSKKEA